MWLFDNSLVHITQCYKYYCTEAFTVQITLCYALKWIQRDKKSSESITDAFLNKK